MTDIVIISGTIFFVAITCSISGSYLVLRQQSLLGDALSHAVLPGLVGAFLIFRELNPITFILGAVSAGILTGFLIETIKSKNVKEDTSMGIVFTFMFALGIILVSLFAYNSHIDPECVLFGDITFITLDESTSLFNITIPNKSLVILASFFLIAAVTKIFHKEFIICAFQEDVAKTLGIPVKFFHYLLITLVSTSIVVSFEAVGVILVIGLLIIPISFGKLFAQTYSGMLVWSVIFSAVISFVGTVVSFRFNLAISGTVIGLSFVVYALVFVSKLVMQKTMNKKVDYEQNRA